MGNARNTRRRVNATPSSLLTWQEQETLRKFLVLPTPELPRIITPENEMLIVVAVRDLLSRQPTTPNHIRCVCGEEFGDLTKPITATLACCVWCLSKGSTTDDIPEPTA